MINNKMSALHQEFTGKISGILILTSAADAIF
jgi:hypothetical protein